MIRPPMPGTRLADLPQALGGVTLATANGKLYAFGGFDQRGYNQGNVATTYEYNPATQQMAAAHRHAQRHTLAGRRGQPQRQDLHGGRHHRWRSVHRHPGHQ